jgi:hypothetical protein
MVRFDDAREGLKSPKDPSLDRRVEWVTLGLLKDSCAEMMNYRDDIAQRQHC